MHAAAGANIDRTTRTALEVRPPAEDHRRRRCHRSTVVSVAPSGARAAIDPANRPVEARAVVEQESTESALQNTDALPPPVVTQSTFASLLRASTMGGEKPMCTTVCGPPPDLELHGRLTCVAYKSTQTTRSNQSPSRTRLSGYPLRMVAVDNTPLDSQKPGALGALLGVREHSF